MPRIFEDRCDGVVAVFYHPVQCRSGVVCAASDRQRTGIALSKP